MATRRSGGSAETIAAAPASETEVGGDVERAWLAHDPLLAVVVVSQGVLAVGQLALINISEPTRLGMISYAGFWLEKKKEKKQV
nr:hypothetical protein [Pseudomonas aeruginosa]